MLTQTLLPTIPDGQTVADGSLRPRSYAELRPDRQPTDPRRPFAHQRAAWEHLSAHLQESRTTGIFEGIMVMPTGGGKTFAASDWLMREVVDRGERVLWLAHRDELLEQAADAFYRSAGRARRRQQVAVRIVSARHDTAAAIAPTDDIVLASVATMARHLDDCDRLLADPRTFLVVDEVHHAPASNHRAILDRHRARPRRRLLGLTATPTRTVPRERPVLAGLFGDRILYEVEADELIELGVLARPVLVQVQTRVEVDRGLTPPEMAALGETGDFGRAWLNRVARIERRNQVIIDHFLKHRARYGKTIIFAINVEQATLLAGRLRAAGVPADFVAARRGGRENAAVLRRFRNPGGGLDVLVSVEILTEGIDLPEVQTVVLARPTASLILAMQMVGRALRGPAAGGTAVAYLVALLDDWRRLPRLQDALLPLHQQADLATVPAPGWRPYRPADVPTWDSIEAVAAQIRAIIPAHPTDSSEAVPERWCVLTDPAAGRPASPPVAVYSHQQAGWEAALAFVERLPAGELAAVDVATLTARFFGACVPPAPTARALGQLLEHFSGGGGRPESYSPEDRLSCDPRSLALQIVEDDLTEREKKELLERRYTPLARAIYPMPLSYRVAVDEALYALQYPDETAWTRTVSPVFEEARYGRGAKVPGRPAARRARRLAAGNDDGQVAAPGYDQPDVTGRL
jgi:superfamily II DNA or RNA helicase